MATETSLINTNFFTPTKPSSRIEPSSISMVRVRVIVRVRPFLAQEISATNGVPTPCVSVLDESGEEVTVHLKDQETSRNECYKLDSFFGQEDNHVSQIFQREVRSLIPGIFYGRNATVFAYGATGSGKTFTMQGSDELPGLMPLAMSTILSMCQHTGTTADISYYEVYMDRCYDLLEVKAKEITVLDDKDGQIHLKGLAKVPVNSMTKFDEVFSCGVQRRKVAHTGLNDVSSRSHGILVISVSRPSEDGFGNVVIGKLNLIDLAGNEDNRRTCNEGVRLQESAKINQSLFALSNVIYALNNNKPHVPYRESKLTRILQDSLGGTSHALMVACLNPGEYQESVHTVSLAARSRHISNFVHSAQKQDNTPKVKVDMEAKLRVWLESKGKTKSAQRPGALRSPFSNKTPSSIVSSIKKLNTCQRFTKANAVSNQGVANPKERSLHVPCNNLFNNEGPINSIMENDAATAKDDASHGFETFAKKIVLESTSRTPEQLVDKRENVTPPKNVDLLGSLPVSERIKDLNRSFRKVLSPVNSNINIENMSFRVLYNPTTPNGPLVLNCEAEKLKNNGTPLDKFSALSSILKNSLAQEYIDFLNSASKEELLELKGIGEKMAEYILELRETSPLKSLNDLEKIGLSSKQVHNMFGRAAKGLFD